MSGALSKRPNRRSLAVIQMHHASLPHARTPAAGLPIWLVLAALLALPVNAPPASARTQASITVARLVNQVRAAHGTDRLDVHEHLNHVALDQAQRMAQRGALFHNPNLISAMVGDWQWVGENVGYGPNVEKVQAAFMNSRTHRANILDPDYTRLGTATIRRGTRVWVVQVYLAT